MKFKVTGENHDTGARMTLEFEAGSRAAAERKAAGSGMVVHHVQDVTAGHDDPAAHPRDRHGPPTERAGWGGRAWLRGVLFVTLVAVAAWYFWPALARWLPG